MIVDSYWPFVLFMPIEVSDRVHFLQTLFSSPTVVEVLMMFDGERELCQKEILLKLKHHSNKTVISALRKLVELGLLTEYRPAVRSGSRVVRMKCYKLTEFGKWYRVFLQDIRALDGSGIREVLHKLLSVFLERASTLRDKLAMSHQEFGNYIAINLLASSIKKRPLDRVDVVVFGSMAVDIYLDDMPRLFSGGSGANIAFNCAKLGVATAFITRIPGDVLGLKLVLELLDSGVDLSLSHLDLDARTTICAVRNWRTEDPDIICSYDVAKPPVVTEIDSRITSLCNRARVLYLGEGVCNIYIKLLDSIDRGDKTVVYRPSIESLEKYFNECRDILGYNPVLVLNEKKCGILNKKGLDIPYDLFKLGAERIVVTRGSKSVTVYNIKPENVVEIPIKQNTAITDTVGAGDLFIAVLLKSLLQGKDIIAASRYAAEVASYGTSVLGPRKIR